MKFRWALAWLLLSGSAWAARIGDLDQASWLDQIGRFFSFSDPSLQYALIGALLLGFSCGLLGAFLLLRRMAMIGDALGHSVLPGVVLAFVVTGRKEVIPLLIGAGLAGLAASLTIWALQRWTPLKEDACMGLVLSGYFAAGLAGLTSLSKSGSANQSGLDKFLFGQAAALGVDDLWAMGAAAVLSVVVVVALFKELVVVSFDPMFARSIGVRVNWIHAILMTLVTFALVTALQAVGAVLVSAMLVTPAATAQLLTHRMKPMLLCSALVGAASGVVGVFFSFLGSHLPTGPCMVLAASSAFALAWLLAPRDGWLARRLRQRRRSTRIRRENLLKDIYLVLERNPEGLCVEAVAGQRQASCAQVQAGLRELRRAGWLDAGLHLTEAGTREARRLVRNHRLWELFLTNEADIAPDHVHRDAEDIEHVLSSEFVARLEERLGAPDLDPHGSPIPPRHN